MVVQNGNASTLENRRTGAQSHSHLHRELEANLSYMGLCLKNFFHNLKYTLKNYTVYFYDYIITHLPYNYKEDFYERDVEYQAS